MIVRRMADQLKTITDAQPDLYKEIEAHCQAAYDLVVKIESVMKRYQSGAIMAPQDVINQTVAMYGQIATELIAPVHNVPPIYSKAAFALAYNELHGKTREGRVLRGMDD